MREAAWIWDAFDQRLICFADYGTALAKPQLSETGPIDLSAFEDESGTGVASTRSDICLFLARAGNPGKRRLNENEPKPEPSVPDCPSYCAAYSLWAEAIEVTQKYGAMVKSPSGYPDIGNVSRK
jgi:hypothetical protein